MPKIPFPSFVGLGVILLLAGCTVTAPKDQTKDSIPTNKKEAGEIREFSGKAQADYIGVEASIIDREENNEEISLLLTLDNHREDLGNYDYRSLASLDGAKALEWRMLSNEMGGHHVSGVLTFAGKKTPRTFSLSGLPVGEVVIELVPDAQ